MIIIDNVLVSDMVVEEQFVCDLTKCKGGCCEDGDAGAPLENQEKEFIKEYYDLVEPYMTKEGIKEVSPYLLPDRNAFNKFPVFELPGHV